MSYLRTMLASAVLLLVLVFPAWGQETTSVPATVPEQTVSPTPNNDKIVFSSNQDGAYDIYTVNPDGSSPSKLTNNLFAAFQPVWSPDGTKIAVGGGHINVMSADGSDLKLLTANRGDFSNVGPTWSPDGTKIAFSSSGPPNQVSDIYTMDADGANQTNLTNSPEIDELYPDFSPDGAQMCLYRANVGPSAEPEAGIYVMNADGSNPTRLSDELSGVECDWSPDGTKIAFTYQVDGSEEVYVMNADGTEQTNLTNEPARDLGPSWSPDGTRITFASDRDGDFEIYTMSSDGSDVTQVTTNSRTDDVDPDWGRLTSVALAQGDGDDSGAGQRTGDDTVVSGSIQEKQQLSGPGNEKIIDIPKQKILVDTGGPPLLLGGAALLCLAGAGIVLRVLRR